MNNYTTNLLGQDLVRAIIDHITENNVKSVPFAFLCKYPKYKGHDAAKAFHQHGWQELKVVDGELHLLWRSRFIDNKLFDNIIDGKVHGYDPENKYMHVVTLDLVELLRVVYDTIGSIHFQK